MESVRRPAGTDYRGAVPSFDAQTGQPATIRTALRTVDQLYAGFRQGEGQSRRHLRKYNGNLFGSYDFATNAGWLSRWRVGGGLNYQGKAVVGYDTSRGNAPLHGSEIPPDKFPARPQL